MKLQDLFKKKSRIDYLIYTAVIALGILIDQFTKWLVVSNMELYEDIPVIKFGDVEVINLLYTTNDGAAFGMFDDARWIFITISTVAIVAMLAYLFLGHADSKLSGIALAMLISGGIGNMIDRLALGEVVDFIYFKIIRFAVFNGADSFVCIGAGLLILALILEMKKELEKEKLKKSASDSSDEEKE